MKTPSISTLVLHHDLLLSTSTHVLCVTPTYMKGKTQQRSCLGPVLSVLQPDVQLADDVVFSALETCSSVLDRSVLDTPSCFVLDTYASVLDMLTSAPGTGSVSQISLLSQQQSPVISHRSSHQQSSSDPPPHLPVQVPLLLHTVVLRGDRCTGSTPHTEPRSQQQSA